MLPKFKYALLFVIALIFSLAFSLKSEKVEANSQAEKIIAQAPENLKNDVSINDLINSIETEINNISPPTIDSNTTQRLVNGVDFQHKQSSITACLGFYEKVDTNQRFYKDYILLKTKLIGTKNYSEQKNFTVLPNQKGLCINGLRYGHDYEILFKTGLPLNTVTLDQAFVTSISTPDKKPSIEMGRNAFVLPKSGQALLPIKVVNIDKFEVIITRRSLEQLKQAFERNQFDRAIYSGRLNRVLSERDVVGRTFVELAVNKNVDTSFNLDLSKILSDSVTGAYTVILVPDETQLSQRYWDDLIAQQIIYTDMGLVSYQAQNGLYVYAVSYDTGKPVKNIELDLIAYNSETLQSEKTDKNGRVFFNKELFSAKDAMRPVQVRSVSDHGLAILDFNINKLDLSSFDVDGRTSLKALNAFVSTERGVYRNSENVSLHILVRDKHKKAPKTQVKLSSQIIKPDGSVAETNLFSSSHVGFYQHQYRIPDNERTGLWKVRIFIGDSDTLIGEGQFEVADYIPQTIQVNVASENKAYHNTKPITVDVSAEYLYGAPAPDLNVQAQLTLQKNRKPFAKFKNYLFGTDETLTNRVAELSKIKLDESGRSQIEIPEDLIPKAFSKHPSNALVKIGVEEDNGRINAKYLNFIASSGNKWVGIKASKDKLKFSLDDTFSFDLITVDSVGNALDNAPIKYRLIELEREYNWYRSGSRWRYNIEEYDKSELDFGQLTSDDSAQTKLDFNKLPWGHYRLETWVDGSEGLSSLKFSVGWSSQSELNSSPEKITLTSNKNKFAPDETVKMKVDTPYYGPLHLVIANDAIVFDKWYTINSNKSTIEFEINEQWGDQIYVTAMVFRPKSEKIGPARAIGLQHIVIEQKDKLANITIDAEQQIRPNSTLDIAIDSNLSENGELIVMAVDKGILNLTAYQTPNPFDYFYAKRAFSVTIRDLYQYLVQYKNGEILSTNFGGDAGTLNDDTLQKGIFDPMVKVSQILKTDAQGKAKTSFEIGQFNGQLQLMVIGADQKRMGATSTKTMVVSELNVSKVMPRFMHLGDTATMGLSLHNLSLEDPQMVVEWSVPEGLNIVGNSSQTIVDLPKNQKQQALVKVNALKTGQHLLNAKILINGKLYQQHEFVVNVENLRPNLSVTKKVSLPANENVQFSANLKDIDLQNIQVSLSTAPTFSSAQYIHQLRRYPLGCLEQTSSKAWAFLLNNQNAISPSMQKQLLQRSIEHLATMQLNDGSFSLWRGDSNSQDYLSMYAIDMMLETNQQFAGEINNSLLSQALQYINNYQGTNYQAQAYALYIMAKQEPLLVDKGQLRYLSDIYSSGRLDDQSIQVGYFLLLANQLLAFDDSVSKIYKHILSLPTQSEWTREGYNSELKNQILKVLLKLKLSGSKTTNEPYLNSDINAILNNISDKKWISTHEKAWLVKLAKVINNQNQGKLAKKVTINEQSFSAPYLVKQLMENALDSASSPIEINNASPDTLYLQVAYDGIASNPLEASNNNISLTTQYLRLDGTVIDDFSSVKQGLQFKVKHQIFIEGTHDQEISIDAPLAAGFEIENPKLTGLRNSPKEISEKNVIKPNFEEFRDTRYLAAWSLPFGVENTNNGVLTVEYVIRAVTKGEFVFPATVVEDMYRPNHRANSTETTISIN